MAWRRALGASLTASILCLIIWGGFVFWHGLGILLSDSTPFEYDHHLPRGYLSKTERNLITLQVALIEYAQHHKGYLPPMQNSTITILALKPYLQKAIPWRIRNPATGISFTPNAALSHKKLGAASSGGQAIAFYDAHPPSGYPESYYITIKGNVGHVPVTGLPKLLAATTQPSR